jgi:hypothetical protein
MSGFPNGLPPGLGISGFMSGNIYGEGDDGTFHNTPVPSYVTMQVLR